MSMQSQKGGVATTSSTARTTRSSKLCLGPDDRRELALLIARAKPPRGKRWAVVVVPYDLNLNVLRVGSTNHVTRVSTDGLSQIDRRSSKDDVRTAEVAHTLRIPQGTILNVCVPSLRSRPSILRTWATVSCRMAPLARSPS